MYTNPRVSDSVVTNEDYAKRAVELGQGILSSCEHGYQGNYYECHELAKKYNLKMLFSAEVYWVWDRTEKDGTNCHMWIGAKNENGRQWINEILSQANETGFYRQARLDPELIFMLPSDDVWISTACVAGWKYSEAEDGRLLLFYEELHKRFGNNFFFEVQYHNTEKQKILNSKILDLKKRIPAPLLMGCDSHYIRLDQEQDRTDFLNSKEMYYADEDGWYLDMPTGEEALRRFREQGILTESEIVEAIKNTNTFLDVEDYDSEIFNDDIKIVTMYPEKTIEERNKIYESLVHSGWDDYKKEISLGRIEHYEQEIHKEIETVKECKMPDYFILNHHVIKQGIADGGHLTKTGRGSAVSFITNMLLGLTDVDRIAAKVKMYPERFMTATRILESKTLPDIDFNVSNPEIFAKAQQKILGEDHSYPMIAYGTQKASAAWKMFAKSQGVDFQTANEISNQIKKYENKLKHIPEEEKDDVDILDFIDPAYHIIFRKSEEYQGIISSWSIAPCAYLLYQGSIRRQIGLVRIKDKMCCLMDGHWAENKHFLKNDLLRVAVVELIYKGYHRAGMEVPTVNQLLTMCHPDDKSWEIYKKSCTLGINQVERVGTASRVAKYNPENISELCAFIAAIRPGFKSMYKTFESRKEFRYGVSTFDNILMTEELPQAFCLYQEQTMAALSYSGISLNDAIMCVKYISKKRTEKILEFKEKFIYGFTERLMSDENITRTEAVEKADMVWQILEDSGRYSFNSSHAYCVALDSLYGAWLKAHHPLAFYETFMRIQEEKGDKDKLSAGQVEATAYFKIVFPPFKFGQDNRNIVADEDKAIITNSISSIKKYGINVAEGLWDISNKYKDNPDALFTDVAIDLDKIGIKEARVKPLIKIDYFSQFGNQPELFRILDILEMFKYGEAKKISKEKLSNHWIKDIVEKYSSTQTKSGKEAKSYTIHDNYSILREAEQKILSAGIEDIPFKTKILNQKDVLGYFDLTTGIEDDRRKIVVMNIRPLESDRGVWGYAIFCKSIGSGKEERLTCRASVYKKNPFAENDILYAPYKDDITRNSKGYWYLNRYSLVV